MNKSIIFLSKVSFIVVLLFILIFAPSAAYAQAAVSLDVSLTRNKKGFNALINTDSQNQSCQLSLYASAKKKRLQTAPLKTTLVSSNTGTMTTISASSLRQLRTIGSISTASRKGRNTRLNAKSTENVYFGAIVTCGDTIAASTIKKIRLKRSGSNGPLTVASWIRQLKKKSNSVQVSLQHVFTNLSFDAPIDFQTTPQNSGRIFVVEQDGLIKSFENSSTVGQTVTTLDIRDRTNRSGEQGLLGMAFHPNFSNNGYIYVNYTSDTDGHTVIARYTVSGGAGGQADPASELVILSVEQPFSNHNGGQLAFGPDGFLYIALGDGGSGGDPQGNGQNLSTLLGKLLRIDVNQTSGGKNYAIPAGNPYAGNNQNFKEEIYAYGLRNPWRFSFDSSGTDLWLADVGQSAREEVNLIERGGNYGWKIKEGKICYSPSSGCTSNGLIDPVVDYPRSEGQSVTGGYVYRGTTLPGLTGYFVYGDFLSGKIWGVKKSGNEVINAALLETDFAISSFGVDENKELYVFDYSGGKIYKFIPKD